MTSYKTYIYCTVRLYADDILIYHTIHTFEDCILLQHDLSSLQVWATKWEMEFSPSKCVYVTISIKHHPIKYNYYISNHLTQKVSSAKYLGLTFDEHLTWKNHILIICAKANGTHAFIRRNINYCPRHIKSNCYKTFVIPIPEYIILYASPIWAPHLQADISTIDKVQCTTARYVMNDFSWRSSITTMLNTLN